MNELDYDGNDKFRVYPSGEVWYKKMYAPGSFSEDQFKLLRCLARKIGHRVSKEVICQELFGSKEQPHNGTLKDMMKEIRPKLGISGSKADLKIGSTGKKFLRILTDPVPPQS
ncbi:MAG: helix-turn-helix domain-containing protein [Endomicrobium sp.]|jgi:DNA-binding response OmpR family regulator|nr:helix-turn-helix domain-containing protein [Endomicrobium sp.]